MQKTAETMNKPKNTKNAKIAENKEIEENYRYCGNLPREFSNDKRLRKEENHAYLPSSVVHTLA